MQWYNNNNNSGLQLREQQGTEEYLEKLTIKRRDKNKDTRRIWIVWHIWLQKILNMDQILAILTSVSSP